MILVQFIELTQILPVRDSVCVCVCVCVCATLPRVVLCIHHHNQCREPSRPRTPLSPRMATPDPSAPSLATAHLFSISTVNIIHEYYVNEIVRGVSFQYWLFPFSTISLKFVHFTSLGGFFLLFVFLSA